MGTPVAVKVRAACAGRAVDVCISLCLSCHLSCPASICPPRLRCRLLSRPIPPQQIMDSDLRATLATRGPVGGAAGQAVAEAILGTQVGVGARADLGLVVGT